MIRNNRIFAKTRLKAFASGVSFCMGPINSFIALFSHNFITVTGYACSFRMLGNHLVARCAPRSISLYRIRIKRSWMMYIITLSFFLVRIFIQSNRIRFITKYGKQPKCYTSAKKNFFFCWECNISPFYHTIWTETIKDAIK